MAAVLLPRALTCDLEAKPYNQKMIFNVPETPPPHNRPYTPQERNLGPQTLGDLLLLSPRAFLKFSSSMSTSSPGSKATFLSVLSAVEFRGFLGLSG